jgi:SAM-dependent methyltransferase
MINADYPSIDVESLTTTIRESIRKHASSVTDSSQASETGGLESATDYSPLKLQPVFHPKNAGDSYHVNELLQYHDRVFVTNAYRAILCRAPNEVEYNDCLSRLRSGRINKIDVLATLRSSPEGKSRGVQIDGLRVRASIRQLGHLPIIGYVFRLGIALVRLPSAVRDQRQFDAYVLAQSQEIADFVNGVGAQVTESRNEIGTLLKLESLLLELRDRQDAIAKHQALQDAKTTSQFDAIVHQLQQQREDSNQLLDTYRDQTRQEIATSTNALMDQLGHEVTAHVTESQRLMQLTLRELRAELDRLSRMLQLTQADLSIQASRIAATTPTAFVSGEQSDLPLDTMYAAIEDRFRGSREEIKERFRVYLSYVKQACANGEGFILDLGCGRGEWLELLAEQGINAKGVDANRVLIGRCRDLGLTVIEDDVLAHLRSLSDESVSAITGFHIVEHLSIGDLSNMLNEVMRVLRPGGIVLFETPNPENVLVGSNFFYFDPSHIHPLPSPLMELLLETRGFTDIKVLTLHPWDSGRVDGDSELTERFNGLFYGPMDYAILGWKVGA